MGLVMLGMYVNIIELNCLVLWKIMSFYFLDWINLLNFLQIEYLSGRNEEFCYELYNVREEIVKVIM